MIEAAGLTYRYPGADAPAIADVTFAVSPGEILGFLGPSGAGKSTAQKVLIGLLRPFEGTARVLGRDLREVAADYYEDIGVGFELPNHFAKLTARENLRFFASFYRSTADPLELLARVGLAADADRRVEDFSKGMKMRLTFVRALLHEPRALFLDEPTSGLDPTNARLLKDLIVEQRDRGRTILLTTHNMHDAEELCDRVAFLVDGRIRRIDTPEALRAEGARRRVRVAYRADDGQVSAREFDLDGLGSDGEFLALLREREIVSVHSQEPSLDDVFIETTGRTLA